jgi:gliding motility-associated-like protein
VVYDGNTVALQAFAETVPCETYRFKLAIADGGDNIYDSGVFLEEGSFQSNTVTLNSLTAVGEGFNTAVEGCVNGLFTFELLDAQGDSTINILVGGTAENGVDYEFVPPIIDFSGGQSLVQIEIDPFEDGFEEGTETVIIYLESECPGVFLDSAVLFIADRIPLEINPVTDSLCIGESVNVVAEGAQFYTWFPEEDISDPDSNNVIITPDSSSIYTLTYQLGTCIEDTVIDLSVINLDLFSSIVVNESCPGAQDGSIEILIENNIGEDVTYTWSNGADSSFVDGLEAGEYSVLVEEVGCEFEFFFEITAPPLFMEITADTIICLGDQVNFQVSDNLVDGASYVWSPQLYIDSVELAETFATPEENISYTLTGTNPAGCSISDSVSIVVQNLSLLPLYTDTSIFLGETIEIGAEIDSINLFDPIEFTWSPDDFLENTDNLITNTTPQSNVVYTLSAESGLCSDEALITVLLNLTFQMPNAFTPNGDGVNDVFYPENLTGGTVREFRIYNQWGEVIYDNPSQGWDGTYNGVQQSPGQYYYFIRLDNGIENAVLSGPLFLVL